MSTLQEPQSWKLNVWAGHSGCAWVRYFWFCLYWQWFGVQHVLLSILLVLPSISASNILDTACTSSISGGSTALDTACTSSNSGLNTLDTACTSNISGFNTTVEFYCSWSIFGVGCSGKLSVLTWSIYGSCTARTLSTQSILAFSTAYTFNTRSISRFHIARCSNTRCISGFYTARYWLLRVLLGVFYSNTEVSRGLILSILGVLHVRTKPTTTTTTTMASARVVSVVSQISPRMNISVSHPTLDSANIRAVGINKRRTRYLVHVKNSSDSKDTINGWAPSPRWLDSEILTLRFVLLGGCLVENDVGSTAACCVRNNIAKPKSSRTGVCFSLCTRPVHEGEIGAGGFPSVIPLNYSNYTTHYPVGQPQIVGAVPTGQCSGCLTNVFSWHGVRGRSNALTSWAYLY